MTDLRCFSIGGNDIVANTGGIEAVQTSIWSARIRSAAGKTIGMKNSGVKLRVGRGEYMGFVTDGPSLDRAYFRVPYKGRWNDTAQRNLDLLLEQLRQISVGSFISTILDRKQSAVFFVSTSGV